MSQDLAIERNNQSNQVDSLFDRLQPIIETVEPEGFFEKDRLLTRIDELRSVFDRDCKRITEVSDLLFGKDITAYGERATAVFSRWEKEGGGPSLPAMIAHAVSHFGLDMDAPSVKAAFLSALLAEVPNKLLFHGNEHYRKVLFHGIRLMATHNGLFAGKERELTHDQVVCLLTASCIHDLGHEGGDNLRDGVYTPGAMEQKAIDFARPYFDAIGLDRELIADIETIVFCTDITFFAGDNSPCIRMKKIYKHVFWDDESEDVSMMMMGKLRRYDGNPNLVQMAMMLHEADIGSSAGLSYEQAMKETVNIMEERGSKIAGPKLLLAFIREQLGETMFTEAGKQLFGPAMVRVMEQAEQDILSGRETFYDE